MHFWHANCAAFLEEIILAGYMRKILYALCFGLHMPLIHMFSAEHSNAMG
jgi:hypothetical protein